jgi:hypothetical protein
MCPTRRRNTGDQPRARREEPFVATCRGRRRAVEAPAAGHRRPPDPPTARHAWRVLAEQRRQRRRDRPPEGHGNAVLGHNNPVSASSANKGAVIKFFRSDKSTRPSGQLVSRLACLHLLETTVVPAQRGGSTEIFSRRFNPVASSRAKPEVVTVVKRPL